MSRPLQTGQVPPPEDLLAALVRAETVTPRVKPALDILEPLFAGAGFSVDRLRFQAPGTEAVENLFAAFGRGKRHLTFAGHVDVVPSGPPEEWRHPPFAATVEDGVMYGRGAIDMKSGLVAMVNATFRFLARRGADFDGRISFLITGDEEGPSVNGTGALLAWAAERGERFSAGIVGEPSSAETVGDQIRIGRRGSYSATLIVEGVQGHAAYPERAENPIRGLTELLHTLLVSPLDNGTANFQPSTFEVVGVEGGDAWNVIPGEARARINSRYNDTWTQASLHAELLARLGKAAAVPRLQQKPIRFRLEAEPSPSDVFLTTDETLIGLLSDVVERVTGFRPARSTGGGTSDGRFIKDYCPVVEFGLVGKTMHQIDECVPLADLEKAAAVYEAFLEAYFPVHG